MAWNREECRERIKKAFDDVKDLTLQKLTKDMDLQNLTKKDAREVSGVHLYLDVVNFQDLLKEARDDAAKLKKLLRHVHVYQRQLGWLLQDFDGGQLIHFQGARLHAIFYKPYDTTDVKDPDVKRLEKTMEFVSQARELSTLVSSHTDIAFTLEAGVESGNSIVTRNGEKGASELLFVGEPANLAAKALTGEEGDRFGDAAELLKDKLGTPAALPKRYEKQVEDDIEANPVSQFETFEPDVALDYDKLGVRTADISEAVTVFADLAGFTKHVASLETDDDKKIALRGFHAVRSEMNHVLRDYQIDFIQYQGDRIQGLAYEARTSRNFAKKAVEAAAAITSALEVAREEISSLSNLDMTNGLAMGRVFVTRVGIKGDRETLVLGRSVPRASTLQDESDDGHTGINAPLYEELPAASQKPFKADGDDRFDSELDMDVLDAHEDAAKYDGRVSVAQSTSGHRVTSTATGGIKPASSWRK